MTIEKKKHATTWENPFSVTMKLCHAHFADNSQLFYKVMGGTALAAHPQSTVGLLRSVLYPEYCLTRDDWVDIDAEHLVASPQLVMEICEPRESNAGRQYFEFQLIMT